MALIVAVAVTASQPHPSLPEVFPPEAKLVRVRISPCRVGFSPKLGFAGGALPLSLLYPLCLVSPSEILSKAGAPP